MRSIVALARCHGRPERPYPEFPYAPGDAEPADSLTNSVCSAVRRSFHLLGLDEERFGTPQWNPLGEFIHPGQQVLIKPNWVFHENPAGGLSSLVTHSSVLRPVIEYVLLALKGRGHLIIGDAPIQSADFELLMERTEIARVLERIEAGGAAIEIRDFRENVCEIDDRGRLLGHRKLQGDPDGYCTTDLGARSFLAGVSGDGGRFRVTNYDPAAMRAHHAAARHEYLIAKAVLNSDVILNVPKLKTHRKAGLTCCLKNVVGINGSKDYLPHHRIGATAEGGDEYHWPSLWKALGSKTTDYLESSPRRVVCGLLRLTLRACRRMAHHFAGDPYSEGSWHGNDTIWRTVMDLNHVLEFARQDGTLASSPQRRVFNIVDAVVAGGGEGPLRPHGVYAGMILAGRMPAAVDNFAARLVGLDPERIPLLKNALEVKRAEANGRLEIRLVSDDCCGRERTPEEVQPLVHLTPPTGWAKHVELGSRPSVHAAPDPFAGAALQADVAEE